MYKNYFCEIMRPPEFIGPGSGEPPATIVNPALKEAISILNRHHKILVIQATVQPMPLQIQCQAMSLCLDFLQILLYISV